MSAEKYTFDQEPVFRSSEGKSIGRGKDSEEPEFDNTIPPETKNEKTEPEVEDDDKLKIALARLAVVTTEEQMQQIIAEYNKAFEATNNLGRAMGESKIAEVQIGGKVIDIIKTTGGIDRLDARVDRTEAELGSVWDQLKEDKQLRGILAYLVRGNFDSRDSVSINDLRMFFRMYPTEESYMKNSKIGELLKAIKQENGQEKYNEYNISAMKFADLLYPEN